MLNPELKTQESDLKGKLAKLLDTAARAAGTGNGISPDSALLSEIKGLIELLKLFQEVREKL